MTMVTMTTKNDRTGLDSKRLAELRSTMRELAKMVQHLEQLADELGAPGRSFTLDGHLVGSVGELIAAEQYDLRLEKPSNAGFDAKGLLSNGSSPRVEIKVSQGTQFAFRHEDPMCDEVIALTLDFAAGDWRTVYRGPAGPVWEALRHRNWHNGSRTLTLTQLAALNPPDSA